MGISIGVVSQNVPQKGLWRDMQTLVWALCTPAVRRAGAEPSRVVVFVGSDLAKASSSSAAVPITPAAIGNGLPALTRPPEIARGTFHQFVSKVDVAVFFETPALGLFDELHRQKKRVVYVPNLDWAVLGSSAGWIQAIAARPWIELWARQPSIAKRLREVLRTTASRVIAIPWSIPDVVRRDVSSTQKSTVTLYANIGNGGFKGRRALEETLRAFAVARKKEPRLRLTIKTVKTINSGLRLDLTNVAVRAGFEPRGEVEKTLRDADAVVHVSRWEGFGYPAIEALHAGKPVLTHNGWPVGDLVEHGHNGLVVGAKQSGSMNLTPVWRVDEPALADAMVKIANDALRARLTAPEPSELVARQHAFRLILRQRLLRESPADVLVISAPSIPGGPRRSEQYWADGLAAHGYTVIRRSWKQLDDTLLRRPFDAIFAGKIPIAHLERIRRKSTSPIAVWHHDHHAMVRRWENRVLPLVDLYAEPQVIVGPKRAHVLPGPRSTGSRGHGHRPHFRPARNERSGVVFIGNRCLQLRGKRAILDEIAKRTPVKIHGINQPQSPVYDAAADNVYRSARIALSINQLEAPGYTSNRMFHACANGVCVVAPQFALSGKAAPRGVVLVKNDATVIANTVRALEKSGRWREHAQQSERDVWRHHTWTDRVSKILVLLRRVKK